MSARHSSWFGSAGCVIWLVVAVLASALGATPARAGSVVYTCDADVAAATCQYLNTTVGGYYRTAFTNASADIYIDYGNTALGQNSFYLNAVSYSAYKAALVANPDKDALQTAALTALNTYDTGPYGGGNVEVSDALATALGLSGAAVGGGLIGTTAAGAACNFPGAGCYNSVITITNSGGTPLYYDNLGGTEPSDAYDFYAVVQHETDEVLGTISCVSTQSAPLSDVCDPYGTGTPSAADLFRYSAPGALILDSSLSTTPGAYFSYNGGTTNGANGFIYNTSDNGEDYGDFRSTCPSGPHSIQDAQGCPGTDAGLTILDDGDAELNMLNAVGYDIAVPEPGSLGVLATAVLGLGVLRRRKRRPPG